MHKFACFLLWISALSLFSSLQFVEGQEGAKCAENGPIVEQNKVGDGKYKVEVYNRCPMCPAISIHLKCASFPQSLVNPKLCKVLGNDECVINGGLPLPPLHFFSFNYSHPCMFSFHPSSWFFQCE